MERVIQSITEQFTAKLPSDREFYTPEDLRVLDIPEFVTERVVIEMDQNLNESLATPDTEWAAMDATTVQFAWKNFIEAIKAEVRMPAVYAKSLLETAVADTLELSTRPRQAIPESLFGVDAELTIEQVKKRIKYITVGRKLAAALVRYMEKKGKKNLTLKDCIDIVAKVDEKLIAGFNSLDWAKETEALFQLAGPAVDSELFRIYFEDKGRLKIAGKFDSLSSNVSRTQFIEILSSPDVEKPEKENKEGKKPGNAQPQDEKKDDRSRLQSDKKRSEQKKNLFLPDDSILNSFQKRRFSTFSDEDEENNDTGKSSTTDKDEGSDELYKKFRFDSEKAEEEREKEENDKKNNSSIYDEMNLKKDKSSYYDDDNEEPPRSSLDPELIKKWKMIGGSKEEKKEDDDFVLSETEKPDDNDNDESVASIELYNETDDEEDVPMWRAFLEREDISRLKDDEAEERQASHDEEDEDDMEPIIDLTKKKTSVTDKIEELDKWIGDERDRFTEEIFDGSEGAYEDALVGVLEFEDWKSASRYIQKEIFSRNTIDVFSEVAVDFTDRLHTFFLEYKS